MLNNIYIKNYALIGEINIQFSKGLNIITGETGAGKSILLGALGLVMGNRADTKVLYDEDQKCIVEATFDIKEYNLHWFFDDNDLDYAEELIIRREIVPTGKSRAYINDTPVTLDTLSHLTDELVDLHQQFDSQQISTEKFQREVTDTLSGNHKLLNEYKTYHDAFLKTNKQLNQLLKNQSDNTKELEFNLFLLKELEEVKIQENEFEDLNKELDLLTSSEDIKSLSSKISSVLDQNDLSVIPVIGELIRESRNLGYKDPRFASIAERMDSVKSELRDISREADDIFESTEFDEKRVNFVQDRIQILQKLLKKHGLSGTEDLILLQNQLAEKVKDLDSSEEKIIKIRKEIDLISSNLDRLAVTIRENRLKVIQKFEQNVLNALSELGMQSANFEVRITPSDAFLPHGKDNIQFLFSANKGGKLLEIKDAASGGEISRLILVIKSLVAGAMALPTMIFDEVDSGVSGDIAGKMGGILQKMAKNHQLIAITHAPQVAAKANAHYFVYKTETESNTKTALRMLSDAERVDEIAKMLSGNPPSQAAIANAKELIGG